MKNIEKQIASLMQAENVNELVLQELIAQVFAPDGPNAEAFFGRLIALANSSGMDRQSADELRHWADRAKEHQTGSPAVTLVPSNDSSPD